MTQMIHESSRKVKMAKGRGDFRVFWCFRQLFLIKNPHIEREMGKTRKNQKFPILLSTFAIWQTPVL
jgi:hypothetical protein